MTMSTTSPMSTTSAPNRYERLARLDSISGGLPRRRGPDAPLRHTAARAPGDAPVKARLSNLSVNVRRDATSMVLSASGVLDTYTVSAFRRAMERCDVARADIVVELTALSMIDSAGLEALRTLHRRSQASGHRTRLVCGRADLTSALAIAGLSPDNGPDGATVPDRSVFGHQTGPARTSTLPGITTSNGAVSETPATPCTEGSGT